MERLEVVGCRFLVGQAHCIAIKHHIPQFLQETVHTVDAVGVPRLAGFNRTEEHFIEAKCVGTVALYNHIRVHHVEHRLRHLLNSPTTNIFSLFKNKFGIFKFWSPCAEFVDVEHIVAHNVHIHVNRRNIIFIFQIQAHESVGVFDTVHKVTAALNHTLVEKFLVWLWFAHIAVVVEELVPEAAVYQVTCGVFGTAHIKVDLTPILVGFLAHQRIIVVWIHIAQIVSARTSETRHSAEFQWLTVGSHPVFCASQWRLTAFGWQEFVHFRELQWQFALVDGLWLTVGIVIHWEWFAPIALTAEDSVAKAIVHLHLANAFFFNILFGLSDSIFHLQTVELEFFVI